ncbi:MAG: hypothetical protein QOE28_520, partial [Solirubrobacteraceae bacterium]|nr:hypothetical protein [Solirubrobacteraceae bacterium]
LRAAADRFRARVERAAALAGAAGEEWADLADERRIMYYSAARDPEESP